MGRMPRVGRHKYKLRMIKELVQLLGQVMLCGKTTLPKNMGHPASGHRIDVMGFEDLLPLRLSEQKETQKGRSGKGWSVDSSFLQMEVLFKGNALIITQNVDQKAFLLLSELKGNPNPACGFQSRRFDAQSVQNSLHTAQLRVIK